MSFLPTSATEATNGADPSNVIAFLSALAALVSVAITSLRKRRDVSVDEMVARIKAQEAEIVELTQDKDTAETLALARGRDLFIVRNVLADNGITDPTVKDDEPR